MGLETPLPDTAACLPCVICGDPQGPTRQPLEQPRRVQLARFGLEGAGCPRCYVILYRQLREGKPIDAERVKRARRMTGTQVSRPKSLGPCAICGRSGGKRQPQRRATRKLDRFGIAGLGCKTCYDRLRRQVLKGEEPDATASARQLKQIRAEENVFRFKRPKRPKGSRRRKRGRPRKPGTRLKRRRKP
jgi:hypothetical protein